MAARSGEGNLADFLLREWRNNNNNLRGGEGNFRSIAVASAAGDLFGARMNGRMCENVCVSRMRVRTNGHAVTGGGGGALARRRVFVWRVRQRVENVKTTLGLCRAARQTTVGSLTLSPAVLCPSRHRDYVFFACRIFIFSRLIFLRLDRAECDFFLVYISHNFIYFFFQKITTITQR